MRDVTATTPGRSRSTRTTRSAGTCRRAQAPTPPTGRDPQARIYRRREGESWRPLAGGLPEPLPAMPYALSATDGRLLAGLAEGQLWESRDGGDSWSAIRVEGDALGAVLALVDAGA